MSPEEAIRELQKYQFEDKNGAVQPVSEAHGHEILMAIESLQKEIPVQVNYDKIIDGSGISETCPKCRTYLMLIAKRCPNCGQMLNWKGNFEVNPHEN